MLKQDSHEKH